MRVILTTVIRHSEIGAQVTGRIIELAWPDATILRSRPAPDPMHPLSNPNPRGGLRGGRGVKVWDGHYYIANYDTVFVYDSSWRLRNRISHPLAADIHEIDVDPQGIWLSCSSHDLALKLSFDGAQIACWHLSDSPTFADHLGIQILPLDPHHDYRRKLPTGLDHVHLNCIQISDPNHVVLNFGRAIPDGIRARISRKVFSLPGLNSRYPRLRSIRGILEGRRNYLAEVDLERKATPRIVCHAATFRPSHNGQLWTDKSAVLCHERGEILHLSTVTGRVTSRIPVPCRWLRGLARIDDSRLLAGTGPCGLAEVDLANGTVTRQVRLVGHPDESVHGLAVIPDN